MWDKILAIVTVIIAIIIALLAALLEPDKLSPVIIASRFFEVMLPILGVGALLKYLTTCPWSRTWNVILPACTLFIAILLAILAIILSPNQIQYVMFISRFFEVMVPILGVGALIKYLTPVNTLPKQYNDNINDNVIN